MNHPYLMGAAAGYATGYTFQRVSGDSPGEAIRAVFTGAVVVGLAYYFGGSKFAGAVAAGFILQRFQESAKGGM
jgi:NhaP-type Na+/H+ or K+/H+ antiporter